MPFFSEPLGIDGGGPLLAAAWLPLIAPDNPESCLLELEEFSLPLFGRRTFQAEAKTAHASEHLTNMKRILAHGLEVSPRSLGLVEEP